MSRVEASSPLRSVSPFSARTRLLLVSVMSLSLAGGFVLAIFGDDLSRPPTAGPSAYSESALGHQAAIELLRRLDVPILVSRDSSGRKARSAILVVAEPKIDAGNRDAARDMVRAAKRSLVVLPKRKGQRDLERPAWIEHSELLERDEVDETLRVFVPDGAIERSSDDASPAWQSGNFAAPTLRPAQVIRSVALEPLIANEDGILLGKMSEDLWVLADPDLLANHGLGAGDNAVLFTQIVASLREPGDSVVFDEVVHGHQASPSIWRTLFEFPLALVTLQVALMIGVVLWSMTGRFGKPVPVRASVDPGKELLIANTADLLHFGGYSGDMLVRYYEDTLRQVGRRLHAPNTHDSTELSQWLDRLRQARGMEGSIAELGLQVAQVAASSARHPKRVAATARRIHHWKEEMLHGSSRHSQH